LVLLYPGQIEAAADTDSEFTPLLKTGVSSGRFSYFQMVQRGFFGPQLNRNLQRRPDGRAYTIAAHIREGSGSQEEDEASEAESSPSVEPAGVELIVVTDLDFISQQFFQIRERGPENLIFDNVTFFLNCMDTIVGEESFISLRSKRVHHRTLERVEEQTQNFIEERVEKEEEAEADAEKALADAQKRLEERVNEVSQRPDLDAQTKQIMARNLEEVENRRFEVLKANIEAEKEAKVSSSKENMEAQIRRIQSSYKTLAVLIPPIPVFVLGVLIFVRRQRRENEGAAAARRLRG
jgi:ABC-2 type transport system permease protein